MVRGTRAGHQSRAYGENVAYDYRTCAKVVNAWIHSPGHKASTLNYFFEEVGVGVSGTSHHWTQNFATAGRDRATGMVPAPRRSPLHPAAFVPPPPSDTGFTGRSRLGGGTGAAAVRPSQPQPQRGYGPACVPRPRAAARRTAVCTRG
ncbi:CAP domain-containing protein [Streptomyces sp. NPDC048255]|uniref:CAP domain-containing protein n=1 Tax=Streptomyces sp. NPDC048255 TaxID=3154713 RepID=UPI0033D121EF